MSPASKYFLFGIFFYLIAIAGYAQNPNSVRGVTDSTPPNKFDGNQYALVVGVSKYRNIPRLLYADDDAISFRNFLVDTKLVPEANIHTLIDSTATRSRFYAEIKKIMDKLKDKDRVIIYFAGHGDVDNDIDAGFLLGYNCEATPYAASDAIDISMLERYVDAITKKNVKVILISDACRSGKLTGGVHGAELTLTALSSRFKNSVKFLSCGPGELSEEKDFRDGGHGIFTYYLLQALYGLCDEDNNGVITKKEIDKFLRDKVSKATSDRQNPITEGNANEVILDVIPELKLAMLAKAQNGDNDSKAVVHRSNEEKKISGVSSADSLIIKKFYTQLRDGKLNAPMGDNAYETFLSAKKTIHNTEVVNSMQYDLAAGLEDDVQPLLNRFTRGEFQDYPYDLFEDANKKLDIIRSELISADDYRYNDIKALQTFFNRAGYYNVESLKDLLHADSILPNTAYINCEIARCYAERTIPDTVNALKYLQKSIRLAPTWPFPLVIAGLLYMDLENYEEAKYYFTKSLQIKSDFKLGLVNLGVLYSRTKNTEEEIKYYTKALQIPKPDIVELFGDVALYYRSKEVYDSAIYYYRMGYSVAPYNIFNLSGMIKSFNKLNQTDSANYYFAKLKELNPVSDDDYKDMGDVYLDMKDYNQAMSYYRKGIELKPGPYLYNNLGLAFERLGKKTEAKKYYQAALRIDPEYVTSFNNLTLMYEKVGQYDSAVYYYHKQMAKNPKDVTNLSLMISDLIKLEQKDSALFYLRELESSIDPKNADDLKKIGDVYLDIPDYKQAINYYNKAIAIKPIPDLYNNLALANEYLDKPDDSKKYYRMAIKLNPDYALSMKNLAYLYEKEKQTDSALYYYRKLVVADPSNISGLTAVATAFVKSKQTDSALVYMKKIENLNVENASDLQGIGDVYFLMADDQKAISYYFKSLDVKPSSVTYNNLGLTYKYMNKSNEAKKYYLLSLNLQPNFITPITNLGDLFNDLSEYDSAIYYYKKLLPLMTPSAVLYNTIGSCYLDVHQYDSAIVYYKKAIEKDPADANSYVNIGHSYFLNQKYIDAVPYYEKALKLDTTYARAIPRLAYGYLQMNKYDDAIKMYQKALKVDTVRDNRAVYYYNIGCARSNQLKKEDALINFEKALQNGYLEIKHFEEDPDLDNIRSTPAFKKIIETYFKKEEIDKYPKLFGK